MNIFSLFDDWVFNKYLPFEEMNEILWVHSLMKCDVQAGYKYQEPFAGWRTLLVTQSNDNVLLYGYILPLFSVLHQAWIQFFYTATWFWTLCYAVDVRRMLKSQTECTTCYHIIAWLCPALLTSVGLLILYVPHAK